MTGGFIGSATTCLDWAIDEMSISGLHTLAIYVNQSHLHVPATPLPAIQPVGILANTGSFYHTSIEPTTLPDNDAALTGILAAYNYGTIKAIGQIFRTTNIAANIAVLYSAPEEYGRSYIVGHYEATTLKALGGTASDVL